MVSGLFTLGQMQICYLARKESLSQGKDAGRDAQSRVYIYTCFKFSSLSQVAERLDGIGIWDLMGWIFGLWIVLQGRAKAASKARHTRDCERIHNVTLRLRDPIQQNLSENRELES